MIYYEDEMKPGMMHDHIEGYIVRFWYTNAEGYRNQTAINMFIEDGWTENKLLKTLKKRYVKPGLVNAKRW